ncbi:hypothetical protein BDQ17DRAFT_1252516 [Cyathus striatus]|nr:hypothetical protein BDQ17DRAFT_1252516 [Cyathus striatus]
MSEQLKKDWTSPIYTFYHPSPIVDYKDGRHYHEFRCFGKSCSQTIWQFLDTKDATSTSNLYRYAKSYWGDETVTAATAMKNARRDTSEVCDVLAKHKDGSIVAAFECVGKGKVTYSHRQHTQAETHTEFVCWVSESLRPFNLVQDCEFRCLMKTGRPEYYLPLPTMIL